MASSKAGVSTVKEEIGGCKNLPAMARGKTTARGKFTSLAR